MRKGNLELAKLKGSRDIHRPERSVKVLFALKEGEETGGGTFSSIDWSVLGPRNHDYERYDAVSILSTRIPLIGS